MRSLDTAWRCCKAMLVYCLFLFELAYLTQTVAANNHKKTHNNHYIQKIIHESYSEVSAFMTLHFNENCKRTLHNCLYRDEWDKVFGGDGDRDQWQTDDETDLAYYYCKPFLIGRFCVDDYMRRSGADDWEKSSNLRCLNGSEGNSPIGLFKKSIHREKCTFFYNYYFEAYMSSGRRTSTKTDYFIYSALLIQQTYFYVIYRSDLFQ